MSNPPPVPNDGIPIWDLVVADMQARDRTGRERYGTPLQSNNGRDALQDAYEECLDMAAYLKQAIEERNASTENDKKLLDWLELQMRLCVGANTPERFVACEVHMRKPIREAIALAMKKVWRCEKCGELLTLYGCAIGKCWSPYSQCSTASLAT